MPNFTFEPHESAREAPKDLDGAIADYDKAIALNPQDIFVYINRGLIHYEQGQITEAISNWQTSRTLRNNNLYPTDPTPSPTTRDSSAPASS